MQTSPLVTLDLDLMELDARVEYLNSLIYPIPSIEECALSDADSPFWRG